MRPSMMLSRAARSSGLSSAMAASCSQRTSLAPCGVSAGGYVDGEVVEGDVEGFGDAYEVVEAGGDAAGFVAADPLPRG